ncbi:Protein of unknown function [Gryllus bimaculatus]|nr:Protein of unknown function [Gryllus bimaculatus]
MVWPRGSLFQKEKKKSLNDKHPVTQAPACPSCRAHGCCKSCGPNCRCTRIVIRPPLFTYYTDTMH